MIITEIDTDESFDRDTQCNVLMAFHAEGSLEDHVSATKKGQTVEIFSRPNDLHDIKSMSEGI